MNISQWIRGIALASVFAAGAASAADSGNPLVDNVRVANDRFRDVSVAMSEGYSPIPCAAGIEGGAHVPKR